MLLEKSINPVDQEYARLDVYWQELLAMPSQSVLVIAGDEPTKGFVRTWLDQKHRLDTDCSHYIEMVQDNGENGLYGRAALDALEASSDERMEMASGLAEEGDRSLHWLPKRELELEGYSDVEALVYNAGSFLDCYRDVFDGLVIALEFADNNQFQSWMFEYINIAPVNGFYIIAVISDHRPIEIESDKILYRPHHYDPQLLLKKLVNAYNDGSAGGRLRVKQVELCQTQPKSIGELQQIKDEALAIVDGEGWFEQRLALHLIAGNKWLQLECHKQALDSFLAAIDDYDSCDEPPEDSYQLKIQACFGAAMMHKMQNDHLEAGEYYAQAATVAEKHEHVNHSYSANFFAADSYRLSEDAMDVALAESPAVVHCQRAFKALKIMDDITAAPVPGEMFIDTAMRLSKRYGWTDIWPGMTNEMAKVFPEDVLEKKYRELH